MNKSNPLTQLGEMAMGLVLLIWLWSGVSVLSDLLEINPLMFDLRQEYRQLRGLEE
jgi:hypothetical protein